ncbi:methylated-DNA--[protein]-cysteine S-methyltransferase [Clostridium oceanicum]|uniref:Methylated-DNA--protein-cysteine methyltransferase n=1 Tax=Clostridium oceanicum TaxID=1543 RepID=A0ABN1JJX7_9CLOT
MDINYVIYKSPYGELKIGYEDNKIIFIKKDISSEANLIKVSKGNNLTDNVCRQLDEYFKGERKSFDFKYELRGTEFQKKVWNALINIPYGETCSYKDIAINIGNEKASRAVGMANNKNPITIVIPCHRVIGANGKLVGYFGGLDMKKGLLKLEKENK